MKRAWLYTTLLLCNLACGAREQEVLQQADLQPAPQPSMPSAAAQVWQASYAAEAAGKLEDALNQLTQLPPPQRDSYLASYRRGWLQYRMGRYADSAGAYNMAAALEPTGVEARVAMLVSLSAEKRWDDVISTAQGVLKRDPENYNALTRLAFAHYSLQHWEDAEPLYRKLLQRYPSDVEARSSLGWTLIRMGKQKEAAELFRQVLELSPSHAIATAGYRAANGRKGAL